MSAHEVVTQVVHLRRGGTSLVLRLDARALPCVLHWGPDLGDPSSEDLDGLAIALQVPPTDSAIYTQEAVSILPQHSMGWVGRPGLLGSRDGRAWSVAFDEVSHHIELAGGEAWPDGPADAVRLVSVGTDAAGELELSSELRLLAGGSALDHSLTSPAGLVALPGLDPERTYQVLTVTPSADPGSPDHGRLNVAPWTREGVRTSGRLLAQVGLCAPPLSVDALVLIRAEAVS
jgi:hypothetical protein